MFESHFVFLFLLSEDLAASILLFSRVSFRFLLSLSASVMVSSTRLLAVESSWICLSFLMVCLAVLRIFWVVLSTTLVRWFCRVSIKLFSAVSMAEFHSALNFGSSFSITRGLIVIAIFAGVFPRASAFRRAVRWDLALSRVSVSFRYSDLK